jgi:AcrR family transcriptional regulator
MTTSTADRLTLAAAELLDDGGDAAVTLRAVGSAIGVSHNAPYKHFANRDDLLAAVAIADFATMARAWREIRESRPGGADSVLRALHVAAGFAADHPARYRLLFDSPDLAVSHGPLQEAAAQALAQFAGVVEDAQTAGALPAAPSDHLAVLLFATVHGLIDADASGRLRAKTGWTEITAGAELLLTLLGGEG